MTMETVNLGGALKAARVRYRQEHREFVEAVPSDYADLARSDEDSP